MHISSPVSILYLYTCIYTPAYIPLVCRCFHVYLCTCTFALVDVRMYSPTSIRLHLKITYTPVVHVHPYSCKYVDASSYIYTHVKLAKRHEHADDGNEDVDDDEDDVMTWMTTWMTWMRMSNM